MKSVIYIVVPTLVRMNLQPYLIKISCLAYLSLTPPPTLCYHLQLVVGLILRLYVPASTYYDLLDYIPYAIVFLLSSSLSSWVLLPYTTYLNERDTPTDPSENEFEDPSLG
jgi:hypothetical protein